MSTTQNVETHEFQAETRRLLDLVIHSLYTHKEIFLRELISNASDAIDRLRFEALTAPELTGDGWEPEIRLDVDVAARTLSIRDNGIGMKRDEVIQNIGSIAKSGTREMLEAVKARKDGSAPPELIGNFGVGFYSAFMAADKVRLTTRRAGSDEAVLWESRADGVYTLQPGERRTHGTTITLELKPVDAEGGIEDYTDEHVLERIVKRYSDFIAYPIRLEVRREKKETDEKGIVTPDGKTTIVTEDKLLNAQKPLWARAESEVDEQEYHDFYKDLTGDWEDPMLHFAYKAEGVSEYQALVYVPKSSPQDLYLYGSPYGLRLYARRVMIMDRAEELLPRYLRFLRGVVDSADLPLNVSRQMLQENRHIGQIRKWLTKKALDSLSKLQADEPETYLTLWKEFGRALKEGLTSEFSHKDKLVSLLLCETSAKPAGELTTLADYVSRMPEGQNDIFYLTAESRALCESSPLLEAFKEKGWEVLYFVDPVDEIVVEYLPEFEGKRLKSAAKGDVDLGEKKDIEEAAASYKDMLGALQGKLDEWIKNVRLSSRLTSSPACLASDEHDMSPTMERMMRMSGGAMPRQKRILELNAKHEIVRKLQERYEKDANDPILGDYAELLYGYAALAEGSELPDPVRFNQLLASLMARGA
ncbi:MAG: molecular chaperone HtpG [Bryobacterales bacterium]|nr:molecular chaperone HtpG [Bryobacterales bacterium]